jgi:hypothetical protein
MSKEIPDQATGIEAATEHPKPISVTRRSFLKKNVYHAPALLVLGSMVPTGMSAADPSFPGEPDKRQPTPKKSPGRV